jgi:hypothetical protein
MIALNIDPSFPADQQLLATCLVLQTQLKKHDQMTLCVPIGIDERLTSHDYGTIIFDTLCAEYADIEKRLQIKIHTHKDFVIQSEHS